MDLAPYKCVLLLIINTIYNRKQTGFMYRHFIKTTAVCDDIQQKKRQR